MLYTYVERSFKRKGPSTAKAFGWQRLFDGKGPSMAKAKGRFEGKGKITLKAKTQRWQRPRWLMPFDGKGKSMAKASR